MKVIFGSYTTVSMKGEAGGLRTYIMATTCSLESLGHQVILFDPWKKMSLREYDLFRLFATAFCLYGVAKVCQHFPLIHSLFVVLCDFQRHIRQDKRRSAKTEGELDVRILD